jgi:hypothetical protein
LRCALHYDPLFLFSLGLSFFSFTKMNVLLRTLFVVAFLAFEGRALSIPKRRADHTSPTVYLPYGSYQGGVEPDGKVQHFLGMDYAKPP